MSKQHDPVAERDEERRRTERLLLGALHAKGLLGPITDEHIDELRRCAEQERSSLPAALFAPLDLHKPLLRGPCAPHPLLDLSTQQNMARAAREGKSISPEIEARMQQDRENAKRNGKGN